MARPAKDPAEKLTYRLNVRMTDAEGQQLEAHAAAAGQSVSDFVRGMAVKAKPRRVRVSPELQTLIRSLGQLGNIRADINQLVKDRQSHHFVTAESVEAALSAIEAVSDRIHAELSGDGY